MVSPQLLAAVVGGLAIVLGACEGERERPDPPPVAVAAGAESGPAWELVYDLEVNGDADLFTVSSSSATPRRLTESPGYDGMARYTPDGARIIFNSERTGHWQIFEIAAEGGEARRLRTNEATEYQHDTSPDGATLAFLSDLDGPERLVTMDFATGRFRELVRHGQRTVFGNPHYSPDGSQIVFSSNWRMGHQIYVVEVASGESRRVSPLTHGGCEPRFTRDGRRVCFVNRRHLKSTSELVTLDLETGEQEVLIDWPALNYDPVFSPDGSEIAFASNITGEFAIYRQRLADGKAWRVTLGAGSARYPDYRPSP